MRQIEYDIEVFIYEQKRIRERLNELGLEGWDVFKIDVYDGEVTEYTIYMKREINEIR